MWRSGNKLEGEVQGGEFVGRCVFTQVDGTTQECEVKNSSTIVRTGVKTWPDGSKLDYGSKSTGVGHRVRTWPDGRALSGALRGCGFSGPCT